MHVSELLRMGADIVIQGGNAIVRGVPKLHGAQTMARICGIGIPGSGGTGSRRHYGNFPRLSH